VTEESDATAIPLPTGSGLSPRIACGSVIYRAPRGGTDGLWKLTNEGIGTELWNGRNGRAMAGAAIAPDGQRLAFLVQRAAATHLYIMSTDGTGTRRVAVDLDVRGAPAWSPDGRWVVVSANHDASRDCSRFQLTAGPRCPW
jgi:hypothetical protein